MSAKKEWEYELIKMEAGQSLLKLLAQLGKDGWEAWFFDPVKMVIFVKREATFINKLEITKEMPKPL